MNSPASTLRALLAGGRLLTMPCCHDALSARLIERAGFPATFMSGFAVSAARLGLPDTGLISFGEMLAQARTITRAVAIPVLGDGDTGYGNAMNIKRTVREYAAAGLACIMIEDQVSPKRCGHTQGKQVVGFDEACLRIRAAVDARDEGADILIMARTDARGPAGMEEAMRRVRAFQALGADILFLEAPQSVEEMRVFCAGVPGWKMANLIEHGLTPILPPAELQALGFAIAAYPLALLQTMITACEAALADLAAGRHPQNLRGFEHVREVIGFPRVLPGGGPLRPAAGSARTEVSGGMRRLRSGG
jgi:2-methylisocitrate lyase-like PEP mutase family enzyme